MTAILQTAGPVSTVTAIRWNWKFLRDSCISATEFIEAGHALETMGYGHMRDFTYKGPAKGRPGKVFVKRYPDEISDVLGSNPDLCDPDVYSKRYHHSPPKCVGLSLRSRLVQMKLVTQKQMM